MNELLAAASLLAAVVAVVRLAAAGAIPTGRIFSAKSRLAMVARASDLVLAAVLARLFLPWAAISSAPWLVACVLVAVTVGMVAHRFRLLPWTRDGRSPRVQWLVHGVRAAVPIAAAGILISF